LVSNVPGSNVTGSKVVYYEADFYLGILACADQHQVCYMNNTCTQLSGHGPTFEKQRLLSMVQKGIYQRMAFASVFTGISEVINGRSGTALRASEKVTGIRRAALPPDQWQLEVSSWFSTGLVMLQKSIREYASPTTVLPGTSVLRPENPVDLAMCFSQKTQETSGTVSFSVLGLALILIIGTLLILTSFVLETVVGWLGLKDYRNWILDDKMQLQRMVFEARGVRWVNTEQALPVTEAGERFPGVATSTESQALMAADEKAVAMTANEVQGRET
jgi:hypothetical protein